MSGYPALDWNTVPPERVIRSLKSQDVQSLVRTEARSKAHVTVSLPSNPARAYYHNRCITIIQSGQTSSIIGQATSIN
jgi:hypothetical protein